MRFRWIGLLVAVAGVVGLMTMFRPTAPIPAPASAPATRVATAPATTQADTTPRRLFDVLKVDHPAVAATQPLGVPVDFADAARLVVDRPLHLDEAGQLWVTHPDAEPVETVIGAMEKPAQNATRPDGTHVVRETVRYVFWMTIDGRNTPAVFIERSGGEIEVVTRQGVLPLPRQRRFHFSRTLSLRDRLLVPCDDGISMLRIGRTISEQFVELKASGDPLAQPQVVMAAKGQLAWTPATPSRPGSGVWRHLDEKWTKLDEKDWPASVVQLSPFLDGTVQQLRQSEAGTIGLASVLLDATPVDEKRVLELVEKLGDPTEKARDQASRDLQRIGPSAWPICRRVFDDQLPEVQQRLTTLLAAQLTPAIGSMTSVDGKLKVVARYNNAAVLLYGEAGVTIPQPGRDEPAQVSPAWISVRPDATPELLSEVLVKDLRPGAAELMPMRGEWILSDELTGPRRFVGNALLPLLRKSELAFSVPVGVDRRGRWLFRQPGQATPTLLIDPTLPDPTPRLPVWTIRVKNGSAGWTKDNWPAIQRGGGWELRENGWQAMDEKAAFITAPAENSSPKPDAAPSTTSPSTQPAGPSLLTDREGNRFYDGKLSLTIASPATTQPAAWLLPDLATGVDPVTLIEALDGKLFLFNQPGRVVRLGRTGDAADPFKHEATFSRNIPRVDQPTRIWLDPAGRICLVDGSNLSVMFPTGRIPREISVKMSLEEQRANEPE